MPRDNCEMNLESNIILCEDEELEFNADCYLFWQDDTKTCQIVKDSSNIKKAYIYFNEEGKRHGNCEFFSQGEIRERSEMYENGIKNGLSRIYNRSGINGEMYSNGKLVAIVREEDNCILEYSADNTKLIQKYPKEVLTNNQKNGEVLCYQDGVLTSIDLYKNNMKTRTLKSFCNTRMTEYDANRNKVYEGDYEIDGWSCYRQGRGVEYVQNNTMVFKGSWRNGRRNGKGTSYNHDGYKEYKGEWKEGIPHGEGVLNENNECWKGEWKNGKLRCIASFDFNTHKLSVVDYDGDKLKEMEDRSRKCDAIMRELEEGEEEWRKKEEEWKRKEEEWKRKEEEYRLYKLQSEEEQKKMQLEMDRLTDLINSVTRVEELRTVNDYNRILEGPSNSNSLIKEMKFDLPKEESIYNSHEQVSISNFSNLEKLSIVRLDYGNTVNIRFTISNNPKLKEIKIKTLQIGNNEDSDQSALFLKDLPALESITFLPTACLHIKTLSLMNLPKLKTIQIDKPALHYVETMVLHDLSELKSLNVSGRALKRMKKVDIAHVSNQMEIVVNKEETKKYQFDLLERGNIHATDDSYSVKSCFECFCPQ